jgi:DNA-binding CsgD family transcriptional regulator
MTIEGLVFWICFVFCLALTAGGMLVTFRFTTLKSLPGFQQLQYFMVLLYTFGFYGLWSETVILFLPFLDQAKPVSRVLTVLGLPFMLLCSAQQMLWSKKIAAEKLHWILIPVLLVVASGLAGITYYSLDWSAVLTLPNCYAFFGGIACIFSLVVFAVQKSIFLSEKSRWIVVLVLLLLAGFYCYQYLFATSNVLLRSLNHFVFFLLNTFLGVYFIYSVQYEPASEASKVSLGVFIGKFTLTSRESDIVIEIYKGKTNQEIADTLFVTLQTIKDHTSRIYQKTEVKSRAQLIRLMRDFEQ